MYANFSYDITVIQNFTIKDSYSLYYEYFSYSLYYEYFFIRYPDTS